MRPLPSRTSEIQETKANLGLFWSKFFNGWQNDPATKMAESAKLDWINKFAKTSPNTSAAANRIKDMAAALGGKAQNFISDAPFVTGTGLPHPVENGFVFHHTYGVPYLPASSIKGMIRAWVLHWRDKGDEEKEKEAYRLFGRNDKHKDGQSAGSLIVFDALPSGTVDLMAEILTPHTGNWRITDSPAQHPPADWISPVPIPFLAVAPCAEFQFAFAPRKPEHKADVEKAFTYLSEALEWIGAGAKTSIGMGRMVQKP